MCSIRIGERDVGPGHPVYVIAEIGLNHNGDIDLGAQTIAAAATSGVDAVKFQNYRTDDFLSNRALTYRYHVNGAQVEESQFDMFKRYELDRAALAHCKHVCDYHGVDFIATPTSASGVADLVELGAAALKNGSDFLSNLSLVRDMARTTLPTIMSVGMATLSEIDEAVRAFYETGGSDLVLLHCVSLYPAPASELHLRKIKALAAAFHRPVGYSDHALGIFSAVAAVTLGACLIEKHFTLDRSLPGPDHPMSSDPAEMTALVKAIRDTTAALEDARIGPSAGEAGARMLHRLSCVAAVDLPEGHCLQASDITFRRPGTGLSPSMIEALLHRPLRRKAERGHVFQWTDFW